MKQKIKYLLILLLLAGTALGQAPTSPVQLTTNTPFLEPSTGLHWNYNGPNYGWWKALGIRDSTYYITPYYANTHFAPIAGGAYVPLTRLISTGFGLLGGGNLSSNLTLLADTGSLQTVANFFPLGDTRYYTKTQIGAGFIPYSGANADVNLNNRNFAGANDISGTSLSFLNSGLKRWSFLRNATTSAFNLDRYNYAGTKLETSMSIDTNGVFTFGNGTTVPEPLAQQFINIKKDFTSYSGLNRAIVSVTSTVPLGDSTVGQGTQGMKIRIIEPAGITAAQSNNMFGLFVRLEPRVNRLSDGKTDRTGVLVENQSPLGAASATDAFYVSHIPAFGENREWETGVKIDANARQAFSAQGKYTNGLDFVSGTQYARFDNAAIFLPPTTGIKYRDNGNTTNKNLITSDVTDNVQVGDNLKLFAAGGALFGTGSNVGDNFTFRGSGTNGVVIATDASLSTQSTRLFFQTGSTSFGNYVNSNGVLVWTYNATPSSASGTAGMSFGSAGVRIGDGSAATARLQIATASTGVAGTAPIKIAPGTFLSTPESGAIESSGSQLAWTNSGGTRRILVNEVAAATLFNKTLDVGSNSITGTASRVVQFGAGGVAEASTITTTQLGYLSTTTSNIQTQIDNTVKLTGGTQQNIAGIISPQGIQMFSGATPAAGQVSAATYFAGSALADRFRGVETLTGSSKRWGYGTTGDAEGGGDAGSNFAIYSYNDAGTLKATTLAINRATSAITTAGSVNGASPTEMSYLAGVTTAIQTQLDAKQSTITFGTGVETALGVNTGSAGAPVLFNGALGTPSSGVATNLTGTASGLSIGGSAASLSAASTLPNNTLATTQTAGDNSTKVATTAYVDALSSSIPSYSEGTWTPTQNGTNPPSSAVGYYTKIGNIVRATFSLFLASNTSSSTFTISDLPFTNSNNVASYGAISLSGTDVGIPIMGIVPTNTATALFSDYSGSAITITQMSGKYISGVITYSTTN